MLSFFRLHCAAPFDIHGHSPFESHLPDYTRLTGVLFCHKHTRTPLSLSYDLCLGQFFAETIKLGVYFCSHLLCACLQILFFCFFFLFCLFTFTLVMKILSLTATAVLILATDALVTPPQQQSQEENLLRLPLIRAMRSDDILNAARRKHVHRFEKREELSMKLYNDQGSQYLVQVGIGTPPQNFTVTLDTGR